MADLISRNEALNAIDCWHIDFNSMDGAKVQTNCRRAIKELPAVDAVPVVHARWSKARFEKTYAGYTKVCIYYVCSACGKDVDDALFNYCPKCGARMDGERRDSE